MDEATSGTGTGVVLDSAAVPHNGVIHGGAEYTSGVVGPGALTFDAVDDYVDFGPVPALELTTGDYTIAFWVIVDTTHVAQAGRMINKDSGSGVANGYSVLINSSGSLILSHNNGINNNVNTGALLSSTEWQHVAVVYDSFAATRTVYIDGAFQSSSVINGGDLASGPTIPLWFGSIPFGGGIQFFGGSLDEVRIYDEALSPDQVTDLATLVKPRINIKPGSDPNSINTCSRGSVPVTIWGSDALDVTTIDPDKLVLASASVKTVGKSDRLLCEVADAGAYDESSFDSFEPAPDGFEDLHCKFVTIELTDLDDTSTTAELRIVGCDDPNDFDGCQVGDPGFFEATAVDSVTIVKDCP